MYLFVGARFWFYNINHPNINFLQAIFASLNDDMRERRCGHPCSIALHTPGRSKYLSHAILSCKVLLVVWTLRARFTGYRRERKFLLAALVRQFELSSSGTCHIFTSAVERTRRFTNLAIKDLKSHARQMLR